MSSDEREDNTIYKVVVNHEEQYSIWPADRENALGWNDAGKSGTKQECLAYIEEVWTDMRPLSLRKTRDVVKNHTVEEGVRLVRELLGKEFGSGHLFTTTRDLELEFNRRGESRLVTRPPTFTEPPPAEHDRRKRRPVQTAGNVYLQALGVTDERGAVRPAMGDKLRQINRFVETVEGLYASSPLAGRRGISVVDMGSGKGY